MSVFVKCRAATLSGAAPVARIPTPAALVSFTQRTSVLLPFSCGRMYSTHSLSTVLRYTPMRSNTRSIMVSFGPRPYHARFSNPGATTSSVPKRGIMRASPRPAYNRTPPGSHRPRGCVRHRVRCAHHRQIGPHCSLRRGHIDLLHANFFYVPARPGLAPQLDVQALVGGRLRAKHFPCAAIVVGGRACRGPGTLACRIETRLDTVCVCGTGPNQEGPHEWGRGRQECLRHVISHRRL